ncbi:MAG: TrpB-like pyridoxal-phosphate dependent enzyme, partial [Candidatus Omnitrophota bacterium]
IVPAPETSHAIKAAIDVACESRREQCVVFNFSGHGFLDLASYDKFFSGELKNYAYPMHEIKRSLKDLPKLTK